MEEVTYHRALNCDSLGAWRALLATGTCWSYLSRWAWLTLKPKDKETIIGEVLVPALLMGCTAKPGSA